MVVAPLVLSLFVIQSSRNARFLKAGVRCSCAVEHAAGIFIVFRKPSPMGMVSQEGNSNTPCFLLPPFQGEIRLPAMRVVVDLPDSPQRQAVTTLAALLLQAVSSSQPPLSIFR
jgi:hypothetical protein